MDLFEAIDRRHSYRDAYTEADVPREDLRKIVQAGIQAPSGCNAQTTTFVIVDDAQVVADIYSIIGKGNVPPALIVCVADPTPAFKDMSFEKEDCAAAVENMLLAVEALGYATVWLDGVLRVESKAQRIGELLGVPEGRRVQVILPIGVAAQQGSQKEKLPFAERAWFNAYGA